MQGTGARAGLGPLFLLISANDDPPPTFKKEVKPRRCCLIFAPVVAGSAIEPYSDVVFAAVAKSTIRGTSMSQRKEITGRDGYIIVGGPNLRGGGTEQVAHRASAGQQH